MPVIILRDGSMSYGVTDPIAHVSIYELCGG